MFIFVLELYCTESKKLYCMGLKFYVEHLNEKFIMLTNHILLIEHVYLLGVLIFKRIFPLNHFV